MKQKKKKKKKTLANVMTWCISPRSPLFLLDL